MLIKACLNGSRDLAEHPALPVTAADLGRDAQLVVAAGVGALHVHPRDAAGMQSLAAQDQAAALTAIRASSPGIPVGVSTALWIEPDIPQRLKRIEEWTALPDFVSVNFSEPGVAETCALLLARGIGIEAGLSSATDAQLLLQLGLADRYLRVLIEPDEEEAEAALATAEAMLRVLDEGQIHLPRVMHGFGAATWPVLEAALERGCDIRIGLEDTLVLPDGHTAKDNAELVSLAVRKAEQMGRYP